MDEKHLSENSLIASVQRIIAPDYKLKIRHFHEGNDPDGDVRRYNGRVRKYVTHAVISDAKNCALFALGISICSEHDSPSKSLGRKIAIARALRDFRTASNSRS